MKEADHQMVNHIRSMIEGVETSKESKVCLAIMCNQQDAFVLQKLYVLLLHFSSTMLYETCYPALFLFGWDHHYLDTLRQFKQPLHTDASDEQRTSSHSADKVATIDIR